MYDSLVKIPIDDFYLDGNISMPQRAKSIIIFIHGSGSNRFSPRNKMIARELRKAGYGTLLFDFIGEHETDDYEKRFETQTLSQRLVRVTEWIHTHEEYNTYELAYFGAGFGSTMALNAAAELGALIKAVVCRTPQTDLVIKERIKAVTSPTLFIIGGRDKDTNRRSQLLIDQLTCEKKLVTIPDAGHLMEKPHMMQQVSKEAIAWFNHYLHRKKSEPALEYDTPDPEY